MLLGQQRRRAPVGLGARGIVALAPRSPPRCRVRREQGLPSAPRAPRRSPPAFVTRLDAMSHPSMALLVRRAAVADDQARQHVARVCLAFSDGCRNKRRSAQK